MPKGEQDKKITLKLSKFTPPPAPKPVVVPTPKPPTPEPIKEEPVKKEKQEVKKVIKKRETIVVQEQNITKKTPKNVVKKAEKKVVKKKPKKRIVKHQKSRKVKRSSDPLANALMGSSAKKYSGNTMSYTEKKIQKLYGNEFNTYTSAQKNFIRKNLGAIHRITQRTLIRNGYPDVAIRTRQEGTNIVSFYLHSNGDISGLRLKKPMGYEALDENTLEVIRIAYKDYPKPSKKTKIIFYVTYEIY